MLPLETMSATYKCQRIHMLNIANLEDLEYDLKNANIAAVIIKPSPSLGNKYY